MMHWLYLYFYTHLHGYIYRSDIPTETTRLNKIKLIGNNAAEFKEPQVVKDNCKVKYQRKLTLSNVDH